MEIAGIEYEMNMQSLEFMEGYHHYNDGGNESNNPYNQLEEPQMHCDWWNGYYTAQNDDNE